jgi:protein-tyrosine phosphatase
MAAAALREALGVEASRIQVNSAGTAAWEGQPATDMAIEVVRRSGLDLSSHRSRRVTPELARAVDWVLVMERAHLASVRALGAEPDRSRVLSEWPEPGEPDLPVVDPFGGSLEAYEECWRRIRRHTKRIAQPLIESLRSRSA